jgi:hypothetical protein
LIASSAAHATTITFAPGEYDNTANTVTGTNAAPVYNNNQTTGVFRDVFWYGTAYNGGTVGVGSPDFINSGANLISNGGSPARATPGGDNTSLNFTGQRIGSGNASFLSIYDTTPGDNAQSNLFSAVGGLELSADVLFAPGQHAAAGGIVALYNGGQDGLALLASNGGGNNADAASLSLVFQQAGDPTALTSINLAGATFLGDTNGAIATGSQSGDHWYRVVMNLSATGDLWSITGSFYGHTDATDPNSALGALLGSLTYSGSLSNPGNPLDLTNPGQIGLMAYTPESFGDGLGAGGTGADPRTDNLGVSITNFTFPGGGNAVPEPATWAMMIMGFGGIGAVVRRRRGQALAA